MKFCANINHGLTLQKIRDLAYEIAVRNNIKKPANWDERRTASIDWVQGFMQRNKSIFLGKYIDKKQFIEKKKQTAVFLDFCKAFDNLQCMILLTIDY